MATRLRPLACERAREWISLGLDGELSELEELLLQRHLTGCEECASFSATLRATTSRLRATPLEMPERRIELPRRRQWTVARVAYSTAAVAVLAVGLGSSLSTRSPRPVRTPTTETPSFADLDQMSIVRQARLRAPDPIQRPHRGPMIV
jgi:predicted anti-sigma-YlaC factor YlaD